MMFGFHLVTTVIGFLVCATVPFVFEEVAARRARCPCRRSIHTILITVPPRHPRARWMAIPGFGGAALWFLVLAPLSDGVWWLYWSLVGFGGCSINLIYHFIWHEFGRWRRGLRAAVRMARSVLAPARAVS
jgi:hypothetical protein